MTERRPGGTSHETWVDRQIREAQERGEFDDLPGAGKPLPGLDRPRHELWWIRQKLKDENLSYLPPALQVRKDRDEARARIARARIARARSERQVREIVADINTQIREANLASLQGPPSTVMPMDEEQVVRDWHQAREDPAPIAPRRSDASPRPADPALLTRGRPTGHLVGGPRPPGQRWAPTCRS